MSYTNTSLVRLLFLLSFLCVASATIETLKLRLVKVRNEFEPVRNEYVTYNTTVMQLMEKTDLEILYEESVAELEALKTKVIMLSGTVTPDQMEANLFHTLTQVTEMCNALPEDPARLARKEHAQEAFSSFRNMRNKINLLQRTSTGGLKAARQAAARRSSEIKAFGPFVKLDYYNALVLQIKELEDLLEDVGVKREEPASAGSTPPTPTDDNETSSTPEGNPYFTLPLDKKGVQPPGYVCERACSEKGHFDTIARNKYALGKCSCVVKVEEPFDVATLKAVLEAFTYVQPSAKQVASTFSEHHIVAFQYLIEMFFLLWMMFIPNIIGMMSSTVVSGIVALALCYVNPQFWYMYVGHAMKRIVVCILVAANPGVAKLGTVIALHSVGLATATFFGNVVLGALLAVWLPIYMIYCCCFFYYEAAKGGLMALGAYIAVYSAHVAHVVLLDVLIVNEHASHLNVIIGGGLALTGGSGTSFFAVGDYVREIPVLVDRLPVSILSGQTTPVVLVISFVLYFSGRTFVCWMVRMIIQRRATPDLTDKVLKALKFSPVEYASARLFVRLDSALRMPMDLPVLLSTDGLSTSIGSMIVMWYLLLANVDCHVFFLVMHLLWQISSRFCPVRYRALLVAAYAAPVVSVGTAALQAVSGATATSTTIKTNKQTGLFSFGTPFVASSTPLVAVEEEEEEEEEDDDSEIALDAIYDALCGAPSKVFKQTARDLNCRIPSTCVSNAQARTINSITSHISHAGPEKVHSASAHRPFSDCIDTAGHVFVGKDTQIHEYPTNLEAYSARVEGVDVTPIRVECTSEVGGLIQDMVLRLTYERGALPELQHTPLDISGAELDSGMFGMLVKDGKKAYGLLSDKELPGHNASIYSYGMECEKSDSGRPLIIVRDGQPPVVGGVHIGGVEVHGEYSYFSLAYNCHSKWRLLAGESPVMESSALSRAVSKTSHVSKVAAMEKMFNTVKKHLGGDSADVVHQILTSLRTKNAKRKERRFKQKAKSKKATVIVEK